VNPGTQKDVYFLDFSSKEYFANEQTRVVRKYEEKISDNVEQIVEELLLGTWATRDGGGKDIDETAIPYNFIGNDRKPFYICTWLASKSVPAGGDGVEIGGAGGYFFWQTRDGFHFRSIDKIFGEGNDNRDSLKKYIYNMSGDEVEGYDANIVSYDIDSNVDLGEKLSLGAYNNRSIFFDYYSFSYVVRNFNITEQEGKVATAGSDYDNVAKEFTASPTRLMSHIKNISFYFRCAVVFTNQVQSDPSMMFGDPIKPIGGNVVAHASTYRLYFKKSGKKRLARMIDSPEHAMADAEYILDAKGMSNVE